MAQEKAEELEKVTSIGGFKLAYPVWRCKICGYICSRNEPPEICPICKASKDRFERFM